MNSKPLTLKQIQHRLKGTNKNNLFDVDAEFNGRRSTWKRLDKEYIYIMFNDRDSRYKIFSIKKLKTTRQRELAAIKSFGTSE